MRFQASFRSASVKNAMGIPVARLLLGLAVLVFVPVKAFALTWDPTTVPTAPVGGAGTWTASSSNWSNGTTDVVFDGGTALFAGTTGNAVTVGGTVSVNTMDFATTNYTLTGGTLNFTGTTPTITWTGATGPSTAVNLVSVISGTSGLTFLGSTGGTGNQFYYLGGISTATGTTVNTFTGGIKVDGTAMGTSPTTGVIGLYLQSAGAANNNAITMLGSSAVYVGSGLDIEGSSVTFTSKSNVLYGNSSAQGVVSTLGGSIILQNNTASGGDSIRSSVGTLQLNGNISTLDNGSTTVDNTSSTLTFATGGNSTGTQTGSRIVSSGVISDNSTNKLGVLVTQTGGGGTSAFSGITELRGSNTYTAGTAVGSTTASGGLLLANNTTGSATGTGTVTVFYGGLAGKGTISGATTIGNTSGVTAFVSGGGTWVTSNGAPTIDTTVQANNTLSFGNSLTIQATGALDFYLGAESTTVGFTQLNVATTLNLISGSSFKLALANGVNPGVSDSFWSVNESWIVANVQSASAIVGTFTNTTLGTYADGSFSLKYVGGTGNDLELDWTANAVPEASTIWLLLGGLAVAGFALRLRRPATA